jgi:Rod binding domain-containing protein
MDPLALETMTMRPGDRVHAERQRVGKVAQQFEDVFVRTLVSSLRQTGSVGGDDGGMFGSGPGADTYADWFDQNLAEKIGEAGHIGIKEQLMRDFERNGEVPKATVDHLAQQAHAATAHRAAFTAAIQARKGGLDVLH